MKMDGGGGEAATGRTELGSLLEATGSSEVSCDDSACISFRGTRCGWTIYDEGSEGSKLRLAEIHEEELRYLPKCPDGVKLRHAPLNNEYKVSIVTNEQAMVPDAIPDVVTSCVQLEEDEAGSACEGFGCNASTSIDGKVEKKRAMQYSPSPTPSKRRRDKDYCLDRRLNRILDLIEKRSRKDSEEIEEIAQMLDIVIEDGANKGSVVYSYATQLFKKKEIRYMFSTFTKQDGRLEWIERTWDPVRWEIRRMMKMVAEDGAKVGSDEYFYASQLCIKKECRDVFTALKTPIARLAWIKRTWEEKKKH